ncbi:MAG: hypothetical protein ACETVV_03460 [Nitrososphaeria archaeon]
MSVVQRYLEKTGVHIVEQPENTLAAIVEAIKKVGPRNCSEIARLTGIPTETVRYKIKNQLAEKGVVISAVLNSNEIGIPVHLLDLNFSKDFRSAAPSLLEILSKIGYVTYYTRVLPQGTFLAKLQIPPNGREEYDKFLRSLVNIEILNSYGVQPLAWERYLSLKPGYYNFDNKSWVVNWSNVSASKAFLQQVDTPVKEQPKIDRPDVFILKELQIDCTKSITDIARKLQMNPKSLRYHYAQHVEGRRLIQGYSVRWTGHSSLTERRWIMGVFVRVRDPTAEELWTAQAAFNKLPFTWFDAVAEDGSLYLAEIVLPSTCYLDTMNFLHNECIAFGEKIEYQLADYDCSSSFTIPYEMFDETQGWAFDNRVALEKLCTLLSSTQTPVQAE